MDAAPDALVQFDATRFDLVYDTDIGRYILCELFAEEKQVLEPGAWELRYTDDGAPYVHGDQGQCLHCPDIMVAVVVPHPDDPDLVYVQLGDADAIPLEEYQPRHDVLEVPVVRPGCADTLRLKAFRFSQYVSGSWVLRGLTSLYNAVVAAGSYTASQWYHIWWPWWSTTLAAHELSSHTHLGAANIEVWCQGRRSHMLVA